MKMVKANAVHIEVASLEDIKEIFTGYKSIKNIYLYQKHGYHEFKRLSLDDSPVMIFLEKNVS